MNKKNIVLWVSIFIVICAVAFTLTYYKNTIKNSTQKNNDVATSTESMSSNSPKVSVFKTRYCQDQEYLNKELLEEISYSDWRPLEIEPLKYASSNTEVRYVYQCAYDKTTKQTTENFIGIQNKITYRDTVSEIIKLPWKISDKSFQSSKYADDNFLLIAECNSGDNASDSCPKIRLVEFINDPSHTLYSDGFINKIYTSVYKSIDLYTIPGLETYNFENLFLNNVIPVQAYSLDWKPEVKIVIIMPEKIIQLNPKTKEVKTIVTAKKNELLARTSYESSSISTQYSVIGNRLYYISYYNKQNSQGEIEFDLENPNYNFVEIK